MLNGVTSKNAEGGFLTVGGRKKGNKLTRNKTNGNKDFQTIQTCRKCHEQVGDDGISCDRCLCWLHTGCCRLNEDEYDYLVSNIKTELLFHCKSCIEELKGKAGEDTKIGQLSAKVDNLTQTVNIMMEMMRMQNEKKADKEIQKQEKTTNYWEEAKKLREEAQKSAKETAKDTVFQMKEVINNEKEKEKKEKNIIIFNLPESAPEKESEEDNNKAKEILSFLEEDLPIPPKLTFLRLGRRSTDKEAKTRPVLISLPTVDMKFRFLKKATTLKDFKTYPKIGISHDKTKKEVQEDNTLRAELAIKRAQNPDADYIIFTKQVMPRAEANKIKQEKQEAYRIRQEKNKGGNPNIENKEGSLNHTENTVQGEIPVTEIRVERDTISKETKANQA